MPKSVVYLISAVGAAAAVPLIAFFAKSAAHHEIDPVEPGAVATVMIEVVDPGTSDADTPQTININDFIVSDSVLLPAAEKFAAAFPDRTTEEIAIEFRSHLNVTPIQNVFRLHCSIDPPQVAQHVLQEVTNNIPNALETALWPDGKSQSEAFKSLTKSKDDLTTRLSKLEKEYLNLQQTTPVIIHSGGETEIPKVLTNKRVELEATKEQFEATIAALAIQQLKPNYSLQFRVLEAPTVHTD